MRSRNPNELTKFKMEISHFGQVEDGSIGNVGTKLNNSTKKKISNSMKKYWATIPTA